MKSVLFALLLALPALGHPPVSVVIDRAGNIYYSDLEQVWRVAPNGIKTVLVPNVHTHELVFDAAGNLYGLDSRYSGEATNRYDYRVWRRSPNGQISTVISRTEGFLTNYSFVRDRAGTMYWWDEKSGAIRKRDAAGKITVHARGPFTNVKWLAVSPNGVVHFTNVRELVAIEARGPRTILRGTFLMGIWFDPKGNVCVADYPAHVAKCVDAKGSASVVARESGDWSIVGGTYAANGDLVLLEWSSRNEVRVRTVPGVR